MTQPGAYAADALDAAFRNSFNKLRPVTLQRASGKSPVMMNYR